MKKSYFPQHGVWLKGNIHSHSTVSDGKITPKELAQLYYSQGYAFLSMTDHNVFVPHSEFPEDKIFLLTGVEHDIKYSDDKCVHVVGNGAIGKDRTEYECRLYSPGELTDQQLIDMMHEDGQFVTLAHPVWSRMEPEEILNLKNYHAIEVFNNGTEHLCHAGNGEVYWDMLLRRGRRVYGVAVDDVHGPEDLFGGWIWVKASERSAEAIMEALHAGMFFASSGPIIHDFGIDEGQAYVSCSQCREIHFVTYPPRGKSFFAEEGSDLTQAMHTLKGREDYVRAVCVDHNGKSAWSNPMFLHQ